MAADKSADIILLSSGLKLPLELKRDYHPDLGLPAKDSLVDIRVIQKLKDMASMLFFGSVKNERGAYLHHLRGLSCHHQRRSLR
ncbi:MAG: hypothetical protein HS130_06555 [Deltaproteobacteria bacterium]|nr:hypothetical protein [Deltaproteobacteria bacterium]